MPRRADDSIKNWITTAEAAALLGVTSSYVVKLIHNGIFEARKLNNRLLLVNRQSLEGWSRKRKRKIKPIE